MSREIGNYPKISQGASLTISCHLQQVLKTDPIAAKQRSMHLAKLASRQWRLRSQQHKKAGIWTNSLLLAKASLSLIQGSDDV